MMIVSLVALVLGGGTTGPGPALNYETPQWTVCTPDQAVPPDHRYCEQRKGGAFMQALYGPLQGNANKPAMVEYDLTVRRNQNREDHAMWNGRVGYIYLKTTTNGIPATDAAPPGPAAPVTQPTGELLSYRYSLRTTRSLLSSPGSVLITQLVEPPVTIGNRTIRERCFLLDEDGDHSARCELLAGENELDHEDLVEGRYVEVYTDNASGWHLSEVKVIAELQEGDPVRNFLDWACQNAKEQGLNPPTLPWQ